MAKEDVIEQEGTIVELPGTGYFKVQIKDSELVTTCRVNNKMRGNKIRLAVGDRVKCEFSMYDPTRGRITWRF